jgi:hypothetical protein
MSNDVIKQALSTIALSYPKVEVVSIDGLVACFGTNIDGKIETTYFGHLPEYTEGNIKKLYNAKWSQRQLAYLYGTSQPKIAKMLKSRETTVPHRQKGY